MLTFIHAADLHLDSPFHALPPEKAAARRGGQRQVVDKLIALCEQEGAAFLLLAGDLFDSHRVYPETISALLATLGSTTIPVFISPGNHDSCAPNSRWRSLTLPANVHLFDDTAITAVELGDAVIYGNAFLSPTSDIDPLADFRAPQDDGRYHVGILHGDVGKPGSDYAPIATAHIERSNLHYLALGHVHKRTPPQRAGNTVYAYSGCTEGRGFDETGDMGCYVVTLNADRCESRFVPLGEHRYFEFYIAGDEAANWAALTADALSAVTERDAVRLCYTGEVSENRPDLATLHTQFAELTDALVLRDQTTIAEDLWARAGEDSLTGLFLRGMREKWDTAEDDDARAKITLALRYGLAALTGGEEVRP